MGKPNFSEAFKHDAVAHSPFLATRRNVCKGREANVAHSVDELARRQCAHDRSGCVNADHNPKTDRCVAAVDRRAGPSGWHSSRRNADEDHASAQQSGCHPDEAYCLHGLDLQEKANVRYWA